MDEKLICVLLVAIYGRQPRILLLTTPLPLVSANIFHCIISGTNGYHAGVMFQELAQNFLSFKAGQEDFKLRLYVGHDGSMVRLASGLGIQGPLRWPALGSEFVFEARKFFLSVHIVYLSTAISICMFRRENEQVWKTHDKSFFVRVMHEGTPAVGLEWMTLDSFIALLQSNVPQNIFNQCLS